MAEVLNVDLREACGTRAMRRIRGLGRIPAVLYGRGQANVNLSLGSREAKAAVLQGAKVVELQGGVNETALIRAVQWDAFGADVVHLDFTRVSAGDTVEVSVVIELRGEAPGAQAGGVVEQLLHDLPIECPVTSIPDRFEIRVNSLEVGDSLSAGSVTLPPEAKLLTDPDTLIVHCLEPVSEEEEEEALPVDSSEPEVISRKAEEEEEQG